MPRRQALTDVAIRNAQPRAKPYKLYDRDRLFLLVRPNGSKSWRLRYRHGGKETILVLGTYPALALAEARRQAQATADLLARGVDPAAARAAERTQIRAARATFGGVARDWLAVKKKRLAPSYFAKIETTLNANLFPQLGERPIREITAGELLACLRTMEERGAVELARRVKTHAAAVFRYAAALEFVPVGYNPAQGLTRDVLQPRTVTHFPHLTEPEVGEFLRALAEYPGRPTTRLALRLLLLTFVRPGELRAARWEEFTLDGKAPAWRIPAGRMKQRRPHAVPLSCQTLDVLAEIKDLTGRSPYLFPGGRGRLPYLSENTIN